MKNILLILLFILNLWAQERVVSLSPSITEILYGLEAGENIVATSTYSLYPEAAKKLPVVGGYTTPNIEKIISYKPTLVVGQSFNQRTLEQLHYFHIQTLQLKLTTIADIQRSILQLSQKINKKKEALKLIKQIQKSIKGVHKTKTAHSVMIVYGAKEDLRNGIYIAGHNIFFEDIIKLTGNTNAYTQTSNSQPVLGYENIIALNPDQIIILHSHATEPYVDIDKVLDAWYKIPTNASKNRHITVIDEEYLHIPSQRVALTIQRLAKEIY